jgi:NADH-quinone oxidoreductase subunit N
VSFIFPVLNLDFYLAVLPVLILAAGAIVAMLQAVFKPIASPAAVFGVLVVSLVAAIVASIYGMPGIETSYIEGTYLAGPLAQWGQIVVLVIALAVSFLFRETYLRPKFLRGEITSLFMMIVSGMLVMVASEDLVTLFVGLELSSIGLYAVVGYLDPNRRSMEGAIKYFVLGSFAAALMLFGFALLYAATGTMRISEIMEVLPKLGDHAWIKLGTLFTLAGLGFKLALAPFHLWAPDAYEAAPTGITAFMATTVKVMVLIFAMRLFSGNMSQLYEVWTPALMFLAVMSMILGNIMALVQSSLKRMLAYSSIAHSGYMAVAICAFAGASNDLPVAAVLFYLIGYALISVGAFGVLMWLEKEGQDNLLLDDVAGLAKRHPWASFALATFMFSFAGMPPTVGFIAKFFVFNAAVSSNLYALVIIGVIGSSISFFYYLRVIVRMYMNEPMAGAAALAPIRSTVATVLLTAAVVLTILLGTILPGPAMRALSSVTTEVAH